METTLAERFKTVLEQDTNSVRRRMVELAEQFYCRIVEPREYAIFFADAFWEPFMAGCAVGPEAQALDADLRQGLDLDDLETWNFISDEWVKVLKAINQSKYGRIIRELRTIRDHQAGHIYL